MYSRLVLEYVGNIWRGEVGTGLKFSPVKINSMENISLRGIWSPKTWIPQTWRTYFLSLRSVLYLALWPHLL